LILIALGIVFLLSNLGALRGNVWDTIVLLWPVILIVIGLDSIYKREGLVGAIFMIGLGTVFLLANFGMIVLNVWQLVLRLWPVLLVAIGLDLVVGRRNVWASLAGLVLLLAVLAGALWLYGVRLESGQALHSQEVSQTLQGVESAEIVLENGAGDVYVHALSGSSELIAGQVAAGRSRNAYEDLSIQGDQAIYRLRESGTYIGFGERFGEHSWDLGLTSQIPLDIRYSQGAGNTELDLSGLQLSALKINVGVGQTTVALPATGNFDVEINGAIGQIVILVPKGMALRIQSNTALANLSVPGGYERSDRVYTSLGFESAANRVDLDISMAIGNVSIRER
jgi:hypothetical protein